MTTEYRVAVVIIDQETLDTTLRLGVLASYDYQRFTYALECGDTVTLMWPAESLPLAENHVEFLRRNGVEGVQVQTRTISPWEAT